MRLGLTVVMLSPSLVVEELLRRMGLVAVELAEAADVALGVATASSILNLISSCDDIAIASKNG